MNPMTNLMLRCLAVSLLAAATGCSAVVRTPYLRPVVETPAQWDVATTENVVAEDGRWWTRFGDAELDRVIEAALARNNDLAAAAIRVHRARLQAGLAANALVPSLSAGISSSASRDLDDGGPSGRSNSASIGVSYVLDLWGRLGSQRDAARWEAEATADDLASARLALIGTTAGLYWQLAWLNERIVASEASITYAQRTLDLVRVQQAAGAVSRLEVSDAEQNLLSQKAAHVQLVQQRLETRNAFAILFDAPPGEPLADPQRLVTSGVPAIAAGAPAALLGRRPDLRAAERRLRATLAGVDATRATYYPSFNLTAGIGSSSASLADVIRNPVGTLGAGLSLPFLNVQQRRLDIGVSQTRYEEAVVTFRQTLYQALADTANALAARETRAARARLLDESLVAAQTSERLYEVRYKAGAVALRSWLDAQERRRSAETAAADIQLARLNGQVTLYQALGGDVADVIVD